MSNDIEILHVPFADGTSFTTKRWLVNPKNDTRATLIFLHGLAEHVGRYDHVWPGFARNGIEVFGYDLRGFGQTKVNAGDATMKQHLDDLTFIVQNESTRAIGRDGAKRPIFLYGHSLGGCIVLSWLTQCTEVGEENAALIRSVSGVICSAPLILRPKPPSWIMLQMISWLAWAMPNLPFYKTINPTRLTSDIDAQESYHTDPHVKSNLYLKTVVEPMLAGIQLDVEGFKHWPSEVPLLISHGTEDQSTSLDASRNFVERIVAQDKEFKSWPGMLHEAHQERAALREPFMSYTLSWLEARLPM